MSALILVLTIVFVVLKLIGIITWSWWWVLAPLWIPVGLSIPVFAIILIVFLIMGTVFLNRD